MQLYAAGFNAHSQLPASISPPPVSSVQLSNSRPHSRSIAKRATCTFSQVLNTDEAIEVLASLWSATVIKQGSQLWHYGFRPSKSTEPSCIVLPAGVKVRDVSCVFGDVSGVLGALSEGGLLLLRDDPLRFEQHRWPEGSWRAQQGNQVMRIDHLIIAGNEEVCISICNIPHPGQYRYQLQTFLTFRSFIDGGAPNTSHPLSCPVKSLQAGATAFVTLLEDGNLLTFGSHLQPALLARSSHANAPAALPCYAMSLGGIAIAKIVMCEWVGAALSAEMDLYIWGSRAGEARKITALPDPGDDIKVVDIQGGVDIVDVALGFDQLLVLTAEGTIWSCGGNEHGQLGFEVACTVFEMQWTNVPFKTRDDANVVGVVAGACSSWIIAAEAF